MKKLSHGFTLIELMVVIGILGLLMGVLVPKIADSMNNAKVTAATVQGRNLYQAILAAGLNHPDKDDNALWPRSSENKGDDSTDITGMTFGSSTEYFKELFDLQNYGSKNWRPYLGKSADVSLLYGCGVPSFEGKNIQSKNVMWAVAQGVTSDLDEVVPVLVTRNCAIDKLHTSGEFNGTTSTEVGVGKDNGGESDIPFGSDLYVMVRKGGTVDRMEARYSKLYEIYKRKSFTIADGNGFKYLKTGTSE